MKGRGKRVFFVANIVKNNQVIPWLLLALLALIWGSSFILMKLGMEDSAKETLYSWDQVAAMRLAFAGLALLPIFMRSFRRMSLADWGWIALVGIIGNGVPSFLFTGAETQVDSTFAGILTALTPFFAFLWGVLIFRAKSVLRQVFGIVIGFAGAIGLVMQSELPAEMSWGYSSLIVLATACYGMSVNIIHRKLSHLSSIDIAACALLLAGIPSLIYLFTTDFTTILATNPEGLYGLGYVAILGVIGTAFALVVFNIIIQKKSGLFATSVTYLIPIVAITWGAMYGEKLGWGHAIFGGMVLSGVYLFNKQEEKR